MSTSLPLTPSYQTIHNGSNFVTVKGNVKSFTFTTKFNLIHSLPHRKKKSYFKYRNRTQLQVQSSPFSRFGSLFNRLLIIKLEKKTDNETK